VWGRSRDTCGASQSFDNCEEFCLPRHVVWVLTLFVEREPISI
jgi:hypothetical protein